MKYNRKKFIYLISPSKINGAFYTNLYKVLRSKKVSFFQLRLKKESFKRKYTIGKKIKKICKKFNVKFLINDDVLLTKKETNADGCHLGQRDKNILKARKIIGDKIIGITCHNSIKLAKIAVINKADYIALGAFNYSKTKELNIRLQFIYLKSKKNNKNSDCHRRYQF